MLNLLCLTDETDPQVVLDALKAAMQDGGGGKTDPEKYVSIEAVKDLLKSHNNGAPEMAKQTAAFTVEDAVRKGILTPVRREWGTALYVQSVQSFDAFISQSTPVFAHMTETFEYMTNAPPSFPEIGKTAVSDVASSVCAQLGLDQHALN